MSESSCSLRHFFLHRPDLVALGWVIQDLADAFQWIARALAQRALSEQAADAGTTNVHGEIQKKLDLVANAAMWRCCENNPYVWTFASEEMPSAVAVASPDPRRPAYAVICDPLDGSSNLEANISVGSTFSILSVTTAGDEQECLQPGRAQIAAGYCIYGPATQLVLTLGQGTHIFTLDSHVGDFMLTRERVTIPEHTAEFAINMSNQRFWEPPVQRYIQSCLHGRDGDRRHDFNMRWVASMVADVHRILLRGGIFLYPCDEKRKKGRLRLLYEANPMAFLVEQAQGMASTGESLLLDVVPQDIHQRVPVLLGSAAEVKRLMSYYVVQTNHAT